MSMSMSLCELTRPCNFRFIWHINVMAETNETDLVAKGGLQESKGNLETVAITGASGFVGTALVNALLGDGIKVVRLVRDSRRVGADAVLWDAYDDGCDLSIIDGADAVVHLAGESIVGLWTKAKRRRIYDSRVDATRNLVSSILRLDHPPRTLICASAVGYYGDRGNEELTEKSAVGEGFLADTCQQWEAATQLAREAGIRVVNLRIAVVLDPAGAALQKAISAFRLGLGGRFGSGEQYMSWITLEDLVRIIVYTLCNDSISGAANAVAPNPITNAEYTRRLSRALNRPALLNVPEFLLRLAPGGIAQEMFLASARSVPARLLAAGFEFNYRDIDQALEHFLPKR
jgi:uncharacterized protein